MVDIHYHDMELANIDTLVVHGIMKGEIMEDMDACEFEEFSLLVTRYMRIGET